jgi:hypothetical protein
MNSLTLKRPRLKASRQNCETLHGRRLKLSSGHATRFLSQLETFLVSISCSGITEVLPGYWIKVASLLWLARSGCQKRLDSQLVS